MSAASPFGKYAGIVAAIIGSAIVAVWLGGAAGIAGMPPPSAQLDAAFYLVVGATFGTGAGALVVANGAGRQAAVANTRLDAVHAPSAPMAAAIVAADSAAAANATIVGPTDE